MTVTNVIRIKIGGRVRRLAEILWYSMLMIGVITLMLAGTLVFILLLGGWLFVL